MIATFSLVAGKEVVTLSGGFLGKDEVVREATDDDRRQFKDEYAAFKNPPPPAPTPEEVIAAKDAEIASLQAKLAAIESAAAPVITPKASA